ncbi:MAG TPA: type II toxin-antitoxin system HicB family antitoxin [Ktedonobacteraceae bacterium]|nr:type II toxin-antitoxin system HicB family antitoxin [Ktedonobacteraceae bacterium]
MGDVHYSIHIHWSDEDKLFIATLPDFPNCSTHGKSYEEALQNAQEVLELLEESLEALGLPLPPPRPYAAA